MSYIPKSVFSPEDEPSTKVPRAFIAPNRYIQGDGILRDLGRYLSIVPSKRPAVLLSKGRQQRHGGKLVESLKNAQLEVTMVIFQGECAYEEVNRIVEILKAKAHSVDCVIAFGGGKCLDTGRFVGNCLGLPVVICPSLASNDAPCAALSVMYTPDGVFKKVEYFPNSPALVVVDTHIVAEAPVRYLVAGIGDAMATWYEARTCLENPQARTVLGARPTLAASAIGELCAHTLFEYGLSGVESVKRSEVSEDLEKIVEANTLLSGLGFESGGLAGAHSIAQGLTIVPKMPRNFLHGEMVAIGVVTQLVLESKEMEWQKVAEFFTKVGLPIHLGQVSLSPAKKQELERIVETALTLPILRNEPFAVTKESLMSAVLRAHEMGVELENALGKTAYASLHES